MNNEEIEQKAQESLPTFGMTSDPYDAQLLRDGYYDGFLAGAKWMQEQYHKDVLEASVEIEKQHVQDVKDLQEQMKLLIDKMIEYNVDDCEEIWYDIARYDENWCANNCQKFCKKCVDKWLEAKQAMKGK